MQSRQKGEVSSWQSENFTPSYTPFERSSKRRYGFPSETQVKRGARVVHGEKELAETIHAPVALDDAFKKCCMLSGRYDGSLRDHYF